MGCAHPRQTSLQDTPGAGNRAVRLRSLPIIVAALITNATECALERVWEGKSNPSGCPFRTRLLAARFALRSRNPVERLVRDAMLAEHEAQLSRMFLHMAQIVELQLQEADWLPR